MASASASDRSTQRDNQLRIIAAMMQNAAHCARILSRDCREMGVDPRTPIAFRSCNQCLERLRSEGSRSEVLHALTSAVCSPSCLRIKWERRVWLYDVAASLGHIETLCSLPALHDDITPRDQATNDVTVHTHQHMLTSEHSDIRAERPETLTSEHSDIRAERPETLTSEHSDIRAERPETPTSEHSDIRAERPEKLTSEHSAEQQGTRISEHSGNGAKQEEALTSEHSHISKEKPETLETPACCCPEESTKTLCDGTEDGETAADVPQTRFQDQAEGATEPHATLRQEERKQESFVDSLDTLFQSEKPGAAVSSTPHLNDHVAQASNNNISASPTSSGASTPSGHDLAHGVSADSHGECRHNGHHHCSLRREIVKSAVSQHVQLGFHVDERLVRVLQSQPCSEDVICVFDILADSPQVKDGSMTLTPLVRRFGAARGAHSGCTPLMSACSHGNEALLGVLMAEGMADVRAVNRNNLSPLQLLFNSRCDAEVKKRMAKTLRLHGAEPTNDLHPVVPRDPLPHPCCPTSQVAEGDVVDAKTFTVATTAMPCGAPGGNALSPVPFDCLDLVAPLQRSHSSLEHDGSQDVDLGTFRMRQSRVCQLAWQPFSESQAECENLSALLDQEISFRCCKSRCRLILFPDVAVLGADPPIIFSPDFGDNEELFLSIQRGECPCASRGGQIFKYLIHFLPACAAAAAKNFELFRLMISRFAERVQNLHPKPKKGHGARSALKKGEREAPARKTHRAVGFDTSLTRHHSERLMAQALRHALYVGSTSEVLHVLDDGKVTDSITLMEESQMSLLDLALRVGDEAAFLKLLDRFGLDIQGSSDGLVPLLLVVSWGEVSLARWLLQKGAMRGMEDKFGNDALQIAFRLESEEGSDQMALMLIEEGEGHCDPENPRIPSALESALRHKRYVVVDHLLKKGHASVPVLVKRDLRWSPAVAWCCSRSSFAMARYLVAKGLDCLTPAHPSSGATPLQSCAGNSSPESLRLVPLLIERGADVNQTTTTQGVPLLTHAVKLHNRKVLGMLLVAGAVLDSPYSEDGSVPCGGGGGGGGGGGDNGQALSFLWQALCMRNDRVAEMAVVAGYRAQREPWFSKRQFPRHVKQEVVDTLVQIAQRPLSLLSTCRRRLRESLGSGLPAFLNKSGLPQAVVDFVLMKDLVETYLGEGISSP